MNRFSTAREALDFISSRIADEAAREGISLSEIERKMLYFSETAWTLPDIWEVSADFDRDYDRETYEKKVSQLIKKRVSRLRKERSGELDAWREALRCLGKEDRYLLVMVEQAGLRAKVGRSSSKVLRRFYAMAGAQLAVFCALAWLINKRFPETNLPPYARGRGGFAVWLAIVSLLALYGLVLLLARILGLSNKVTRAFDWILGMPKRGG